MSDSTPICRCRVLYLGSSVPQVTKDGLQGIQEPLQELYPEQGALGARGIDSWLSVWSNGILLENVDENHKKITRFFPIESLHYCAAIRYVLVPEKNSLHTPTARFLPLDSPFARAPNPAHPPLFAGILRRTTGIKVLECHAFICKREVAANALVRCCFHAYADSSYARQAEGGREGGEGSVYGTLQRGPSKEKVRMEEWKLPRSHAGSTTTINSLHHSGHNSHSPQAPGGDTGSVYSGGGAGDENHKVWAGSQDHLEDAIYDVYATSTLTRPSRPRQVAAPVQVPPPPPPPQGKDKDKKKKGKKNGVVPGGMMTREEAMWQHQGPPHPGGKANSVSGTMLKPRNHHQYPPPPMYIMPNMPHMQTLPNPRFFKHGNTYSHRPNKKMLIPARPVAPPFVPMPPMIIPTTMPKKKKNKPLEEPIYMPSNRALSPVASYQPVNFPHEAYLMQHYATMENVAKIKKKEKTAEKAKMNKKMAQSMNGLDDPNLADESPFNTGIYRKKGHLNERAFSYSIRQEHRSRSYGSLANLKFATPIPNGDNEVEDREDIKKEREIMQMVQDLDLSGDEIERSEVPRSMYDARGGTPMGPVIVSAPLVNGKGHRR